MGARKRKKCWSGVRGEAKIISFLFGEIHMSFRLTKKVLTLIFSSGTIFHTFSIDFSEFLGTLEGGREWGFWRRGAPNHYCYAISRGPECFGRVTTHGHTGPMTEHKEDLINYRKKSEHSQPYSSFFSVIVLYTLNQYVVKNASTIALRYAVATINPIAMAVMIVFVVLPKILSRFAR